MLSSHKPQPARAATASSGLRQTPMATGPPLPGPVAQRRIDPQKHGDALARCLARSVQQRARSEDPGNLSGPIIQRWWAGTRQLSGLGGLGKPWDLGGNPLGIGGVHKHLFFEDGLQPPDIGHMGPTGLGSDTDHSQDEYTVTDRGTDDHTMRNAVKPFVPAPPYSLLSENCQHWVNRVLKQYKLLKRKAAEHEQLDSEMYPL